MELSHRRAIKTNLKELVNKTNYNVIVSYIEKNDKEHVIPERCMREWQTRQNVPGWAVETLITTFYDEIQKRGPKAFSMLVSALQNTGPIHQELARLLDPSLSEEQYSNSQVQYEVYEEQGEHYLFIDEAWEDNPYKNDRNALKCMFLDFGYSSKSLNQLPDPDDNVASCVVINFNLFRNDGKVERDEKWIHENFLSPGFLKKPKILISLRYKANNSYKVETDSGLGRHKRAPYNDILWVKIYIPDGAGNESNPVSQVVQELIRICTSDTSSDLSQILKKLNFSLEQLGNCDSVEVQKWGFDKLFYLKKT